MATCKHCGQPIIFRKSVKMPDGTVRRSKRAIPIHVTGSCTKKP